MIELSKCTVKFVSSAPPIEVLSQFFQAPSSTSTLVFLRQLVAYRPHPVLEPVWVKLERNGKHIGLATLYLPPKQAPVEAPVFIGNFVIDQEWRGQGLGRFLLQHMIHYCKTRKFSRLSLEFTAQSLRFWQANGFEGTIAFPNLLFKSI
jgi:GNAT superfamily N-acetyltransferase